MSDQDPAVFIGSSSEGKQYAEYLQAALDEYCEATVWDQGVFGLSLSSLSALSIEAKQVDFAVLVLTPDDITVKRGVSEPSARDNVVFEAGLFIGALGAKRTALVYPTDMRLDLPTDLLGTTMCAFRSRRVDENLRATMNPVALKIRELMRTLGARRSGDGAPVEEIQEHTAMRPLAEEKAELDRELDALSTAAEAQGWTVKTRTDSVFRLLDRDGTRYSLSIASPRPTRVALREFARELNERGLRCNRTLLLPVDAVPPKSDQRGREGRGRRGGR
ncbi:nucleotide-binding protein [Conexibacter sp. JD483]|uniref:TIR domain-containing protein n=1 Tax=unclassified Conexibacter TaxID=2627773 RepID=UPI002724E523|nr:MULTISPECIES: TIR domain-containing protein [unclassified Conexibacter]MDO8185380.1 nucleotide-binding protein [Conexibacter sp. CPCC 205706]MDO8198444.1 nucleotide-binding protein [Conexibacter sp. CPCC 205762]MDR9368791.1 nucleotide-binding protein [Conexibacter sp. JD483]